MKKIMMGLLALTSLSAFAQSPMICYGQKLIDLRTNEVLQTYDSCQKYLDEAKL